MNHQVLSNDMVESNSSFSAPGVGAMNASIDYRHVPLVDNDNVADFSNINAPGFATSAKEQMV